MWHEGRMNLVATNTVSSKVIKVNKHTQNNALLTTSLKFYVILDLRK